MALRSLPRPLAVALVTLALAACDAGSLPPPLFTPEGPFQADDLPRATPAEQNLDADRLEAAFGDARSAPGAPSLTVVRGGHLVAEAYFGSLQAQSAHPVRSVSKSVVALLVGIAIAEGALDGVDQPIGSVLDGTVALTAVQRTITVGDLLTMQSGIAWDEGEFLAWQSAPDPVGYLLDRPQEAEPGTRFRYNSAAVHLLSVVLEQATGTPLQGYAADRLFTPLGIQEASWDRLPDGRASGGAGLRLRPRDLAKLGVLLLEGGRWAGAQVVPQAWVEAMLSEQVELGLDGPDLQDVDYGYLWWLDRGQTPLAWGWGGQFLYLDAARDLVVVTTAASLVPADRAHVQEAALMDIVLNGVVPAAR